MAKYEQGTAPGVIFINREVLFAFRGGKLELKDEKVRENGGTLHDKLIAAGAICIEDGRI
ncbi:hypothetical protein [uncultured Desulfobulbus sp.]|uniref:hypothetical protein n=1 Tax=uncultured Desulfobulbus sp. TaxID=239745 RepID=UPI0029C7563A|nr:hypothetical protein [uncultured Desulfobulbus sp.]